MGGLLDCLYRFAASPVILHCFVEKLAISSGISLTCYLSLCLSTIYSLLLDIAHTIHAHNYYPFLLFLNIHPSDPYMMFLLFFCRWASIDSNLFPKILVAHNVSSWGRLRSIYYFRLFLDNFRSTVQYNYLWSSLWDSRLAHVPNFSGGKHRQH